MKKLFQISPDAQTEIVQPVLSISLGEKDFSFAISNAAANKLYHLASFTADEMTPDVLAEILSMHPEASATFYKVAVCYHYPQQVLVPPEFYSSENFAEMWKAVHGPSPARNIISENTSAQPAIGGQLNSIYAVPQDIQQFLMRRYPTATFRHFSTLALKNIANNETGLLQADFGVDEFELIAQKQNKLLLAERFEYTSPQDVIYQMLSLCNAYSISPYDVQVKLSGLIDRDSALFKELYQYFLKIEFRDADWTHTDYPLHFFTALNDIARCAS